MQRRVHIWLSGRVQGVGFRMALEREARRLRVDGWARNLPDGRVEALVQGDATAVDQALAWCRLGPPSADVTSIETAEETPQSDLKGFRIRSAANE